MRPYEIEQLPPRLVRRIAEEARRIASKFSPSQRRRVLLIGGLGYIGGPLTAHLLGSGYAVTTLDLAVYQHGKLSLSYMAHPDYRLVIGDMGDAATLNRAMEGVTDVVILAGLVGDPITKKFPRQAHEINELALCRCIDGLNGRGLERVIFISTCSNYGLVENDDLVNEESPLAPLSLYARSKVAAENYILSLEGSVDYQPTILRFATAFGLAPRMRFDLTVNQFARELCLGRELVVYDACTWRPYCHVRDFARLIDRVLTFPADDVAFEVFNAGTERNNQTKQGIVDAIISRIPTGRVSYQSQSSDRRNYRVDFSKVRSKLLFEALCSIEDGVDEILWAIRAGLLDDADRAPNIYYNDSLPGLMQRSRQDATVS